MSMAPRLQLLVPLALLVACGSQTANPPVLHLAGGGGAKDSAATAALAPTAEGSAVGGTAGGDYQLTGTLPTGTPDDAAAWTLSKGSADTTALKRALHTTVLDVSTKAGKAWYWSPCSRDVAVSSDGAVSSSDGSVTSSGGGSSSYDGGPVSSCAIAVGSGVAVPNTAPGSVGSGTSSSGSGTSSSGSGTSSSGSVGSGSATTPATTTTAAPPPDAPAPPVAGKPAPGPSAPGSIDPVPASPPGPLPSYSPPPTPPDLPTSTVRTAVRPVFEALGISMDDVTIETSPYGGSGSFDPQVGGLQVVGLTTRVDVDQKGAISYAAGWLGDPSKADLYPLITAKKAFDAIPIAPRMELACPVGPDGKGCVAPQPQEITGAHLGLLAQPLQEDGSILVPAWLFDVKGATQPLAQIAVEDSYLGAPTPEPVNIGSAEPAPPPAQVDPVAPSTTAVSIDAAFTGTKANEVVVQYGDSGSCPHTHVTHDVKEDATSVYVVLEADAMKTGVACTDDYHAVRVTIALQAPLGDRTVVDANGGKEVPVTASPTP